MLGTRRLTYRRTPHVSPRASDQSLRSARAPADFPGDARGSLDERCAPRPLHGTPGVGRRKAASFTRGSSFIKHQVVTDPPYRIVGFGEMVRIITKVPEETFVAFNEVWPLRAHRHFDGGRFREMGKRTGGGHRALQPPERIQVRQRLRAFATLPLRVRGGAPCARSNAHPLSCFRDPPSRA